MPQQIDREMTESTFPGEVGFCQISVKLRVALSGQREPETARKQLRNEKTVRGHQASGCNSVVWVFSRCRYMVVPVFCNVMQVDDIMKYEYEEFV